MADTYTVERSATINAAPAEVFANIADFEKWGAWGPWDELDPAMTKTFHGETGQPGSGYHWVGNRKVGEGRMTASSVTEPSEMVIDLEFIKPFKSVCETIFTVDPDGDGSKVTWRMEGKHTFMSKVMGIFKSMDSMVGPDFEKGLANLRSVCEN